ncbi:MAG: DUF6074 family protein [Rhizobium sp.]|nr:DUF6074 family protein [Rhizobium sp.]
MDKGIPAPSIFAPHAICAIKAFPLGRRIGCARRVAAALRIRPDNLRGPYWNLQSEKLRQELLALGYPEHSIVTQLDDFRLAVLREGLGEFTVPKNECF